MSGVELRTRGEIFVKYRRRECSFAYDSYSSKDVRKAVAEEARKKKTRNSQTEEGGKDYQIRR